MSSITRQQFLFQLYFGAIVSNSIRTSPDLRRVAYIARPGQSGQCVILDGAQGDLFDGIVLDSLRFSFDSRQVVYVAGIGGKQFVVQNGHREPSFDLTSKGRRFSAPMVGASRTASRMASRGTSSLTAFVMKPTRVWRMCVSVLTADTSPIWDFATARFTSSSTADRSAHGITPPP